MWTSPSLPLAVSGFDNGGLYELPALRFRTNNIFLDVAAADAVYLKLLNRNAIGYHKEFFWSDTRPPHPIRYAEGLELRSEFETALDAFPQLRLSPSPSSLGVGNTPDELERLCHCLLLHKINQDRISGSSVVAVPQSRFVYFRRSMGRWFGWGAPTRLLVAGIVQERVEGTALWDMYSPRLGGVTSGWRHHLPDISSQLRAILDGPMCSHFDWNPQNFIYNPSERRAYYIDSKPTTFQGFGENEHNLRGIRMFFLV